jgi:hypothetical protein
MQDLVESLKYQRARGDASPLSARGIALLSCSMRISLPSKRTCREAASSDHCPYHTSSQRLRCQTDPLQLCNLELGVLALGS